MENDAVDIEQEQQEVKMTKQNDAVEIELPAPSGWKKKYTPKKGGTPRRNAIVFVSPTGEEIKSKMQLDRYLKSHPGGPAASEFDWGTGDTPRRSSRLSEKSKVTESPESETPKKRQRKSSSKEEAKEETDMEGEPENVESKDAPAERSGGGPDVEMADGKHAGESGDGEIITREGQPGENNAEEKSGAGEVVTDMTPVNEDDVVVRQKTGEDNNEATGKDNDEPNEGDKTGKSSDELNMEKTGENNSNTVLEEKTGENNGESNVEEKVSENNVEPNFKNDDDREAEIKPSDVKEEDADSKPLPSSGMESEETRSNVSKPGSACEFPSQNEAAACDGKVGDSGDANTGQLEHPLKATADEATATDILKNIKESSNPLEDQTVQAIDRGAAS